VHIPDELASPTHFEEQSIVSDVKRHPSSLADVTKAYTEAMSSSVKFLITDIECMAKKLQVARQSKEQSTGSTKVEMKKEILSKLSTLETIM